MATRTITTRTRRAERTEEREFGFTSQAPKGITGSTSLAESVVSYKKKAWEAYHQLPFPTTSDEAWRRTDIRKLHIGDLLLPQEAVLANQTLTNIPTRLLRPIVGEQYAGQIVIDANQVQSNLSPELAAQGVLFTDLEIAEQHYPYILEMASEKVVRPDEGKFSALVGAYATTGILVYIPRGVEVKEPLHSILWGSGINIAYLSRIVVIVDEGASLTYVHEAASLNESNGQSMHAGIVELVVKDNAKLRFVELQSWGDHVWNFSHERAVVGRDANLEWIFGAVGSHLTKNFSDLDLKGEGAMGRMSGFYFSNGDQHLDHDTQQNHLAPHTTSDLLFKGALKGKSRSVWQGMIYVAPGAQKTDGYQANRNLILSEQARADSIPGLEILADDVRCTHGATVGKIDPDLVFYLRSRGIPVEEAERLIVEGFFDPIMQRIPFEGVRNRFQTAIEEKMN